MAPGKPRWRWGGDVSFVPAPSRLTLPPRCVRPCRQHGRRGSPLPAPLHPSCLGAGEHRGSGRESPRRSSEGWVCSLRLSFPTWNSPSRSPHCSKAKEIGELIAFLPGGWVRVVKGTERASRKSGCPQTQIALPPSSLPFRAFPFTHRLAYLPASSACLLEAQGFRGCCSQRSYKKHRGGGKAVRKDRKAGPLGLSGGSGRICPTTGREENVSGLPLLEPLRDGSCVLPVPCLLSWQPNLPT